MLKKTPRLTGIGEINRPKWWAINSEGLTVTLTAYSYILKKKSSHLLKFK